MAGWGSASPAVAPTKKDITEYFRPVTELESAAVVRMLIYGKWKVGKSYEAYSSVRVRPPIYVINTEGDVDLDALPFTQAEKDKIHVFQAMQFADKKGTTLDLVRSLEELTNAIDVLTDMILANEESDKPVYGTIVIDSITDVWDWLGMWLDTIETKKNKKDGSMVQTEWSKANKKYTDLIRVLLRTNWTVIGTARAERAYVGATPQDYDEGKWQKKTPHWFNLITQMKAYGTTHELTIEGGRFGDLIKNQKLTNPDFGDVMEFLKTKTGIKFRQ